MQLIFAHVPKAGGTSIHKVITEKFGDSLYLDNDRPADPTSPMNMDPDGFLSRHHNGPLPFLAGRKAIFGHFWIRKYDNLRADLVATILREPIDRAISNYFFWIAPRDVPPHPLRDYVVNQELSFLEFARLPIMRWFYTRHMFRSVDMKRFDYIGEFEEIKTRWSEVMGRLDLQAPITHERQTKSYVPEYDQRRAEILSDPSIMAQLRKLFADDIRFYEEAVSLHN